MQCPVRTLFVQIQREPSKPPSRWARTHRFSRVGHFILFALKNTEESDLTGSVNLLDYYGLKSSYYKMSTVKKLKEELSSFLPSLPGFLDIPASEDGSSLKQLYENPPRVRKEIEPLPPQLLSGFRLQPGELPEKFRLMDINAMKKQHKKRRRRDEISDSEASPEAKRLRKEKDEERRSKKKDKKRKRKDEHQNGV